MIICDICKVENQQLRNYAISLGCSGEVVLTTNHDICNSCFERIKERKVFNLIKDNLNTVKMPIKRGHGYR